MSTEELGVRGVRALAHPLRLKLLDLLRFEGPSTATRLGERIGESSGSTSYHLRLLAKYGYIEEAPGHRGRGRWWAYCERQVTVPQDAATDGLLAALLSREAYALDRFLAERSKLPDWDAAAFFHAQAFRLTAAELDELRGGIEALLAPLRRAGDDAPLDALPVRVLTFGFPQPLEQTE